MAEIKAFNRWSVTGIVVKDLGLQNYINLTPKIVPKTGAKHIGTRFHKSKNFIVERLINKVMNPGHKSKEHFKTSYHCTGKGITAYKIVERAFEIIEEKTKQNPVKVFVEALVNAAPREEIITIEYGGARYPKAVESAPQRRVDYVLRLFTQLSYHKSFGSKKAIEECLAEEIINAYKMSPNSGAISKKLEMERQADASR
ncbi:30S ribosomal protein S7 [Candidatus Woesearchaeota archaeon]|nr:30S ribosomal protein S7 [Candidatus Woesearchaeota archaeon]MBW3021338.1 30S ribosomal protein S7 [Candidatus Woesearchaeota archaeon]